jgi:hypothetical protein
MFVARASIGRRRRNLLRDTAYALGCTLHLAWGRAHAARHGRAQGSPNAKSLDGRKVEDRVLPYTTVPRAAAIEDDKTLDAILARQRPEPHAWEELG